MTTRKTRINYLKANGQRIVLHEQLDVVAGPQQFHNSLLVGGAGHIVAVHLQNAVAHAQLPGTRRNAAGHDLSTTSMYVRVNCTQLQEVNTLTCDMKMPGSWAPNGTHEWSVPPMMLKPREPWFLGSTTSWNAGTETRHRIWGKGK